MQTIAAYTLLYDGHALLKATEPDYDAAEAIYQRALEAM
jgi:hypothetical protein